MATIEINEAVFCQNHTLEVVIYLFIFGLLILLQFGSKEREPITCPPVSQNDDGIYVCNAHESGGMYTLINFHLAKAHRPSLSSVLQLEKADYEAAKGRKESLKIPHQEL
ncbi:hypothetical protein N7456_004470 [Penicillium angulare]|uniref:Uncharacterized protein n=1 Tax=Penicillium angulare TaxID=116970 RepID=A0A9W9FXH3_9EURO|nr:hypothetical protein N7456_004470 [Penicillium angulare]